MKTLVDFIKESIDGGFNEFCILKPGFIDKKSDFENELKNDNWQIMRQYQCQLTPLQVKNLYKPHKDKDFYKELCDYMSSDECVCYTVKKDCEDPVKDMDIFKDRIRKAWSKDEMRNAMHSSDSKENVIRESHICKCD